jgi:hypothetical protein
MADGNGDVLTHLLETIRLWRSARRSTPPSATMEKNDMKKMARLSGISFRPDLLKGGYVCTIRWGRRQETWWVEPLEKLRLDLAIRLMLKKASSILVRAVKKA